MQDFMVIWLYIYICTYKFVCMYVCYVCMYVCSKVSTNKRPKILFQTYSIQDLKE